MAILLNLVKSHFRYVLHELTKVLRPSDSYVTIMHNGVGTRMAFLLHVGCATIR